MPFPGDSRNIISLQALEMFSVASLDYNAKTPARQAFGRRFGMITLPTHCIRLMQERET
jgi:hypothetical protein